MFSLRPYQQNILDDLRSEVRSGRNPLAVCGCGSGKGTIISVIVHGAVQRGHRVIFAVHGKSLVVDMSERVAKLGIKHGILMGGERRERWHPVQVASIDTLHRMEHPPEAKLIICDEAHMSMSPTWRKTLDRYPHARVIGATATPIRLDGKGLGKATGGLFDSMVLGPSEQELIDMGFLVRSKVLAPPPPSDLGSVKKTAGEFNQKQLATVCDKAKLIGDIVKHWKKYAEGKKTAAFGVDQAHALHIKEEFSAAGVEWAYVDASTPQDQRANIWRDLDHGSLMGVASVGCISVGWDHPVVSCLVMARPTASMGLWRQMLGRGSRPHPGKDHFLVLDHAGNTHRHAPYGLFEESPEWSLDGAAIKEPGEKAESIATCKHTYRWPDGRVQYPCYATFKAGPKECPFCGMPLRVVARKIQVEDGELREIAGATPITIQPSHRTAYESMMRHAQDKGYKPGWAGFAFKGKFGYWPPKRWATEWLSRELNKEMARV